MKQDYNFEDNCYDKDFDKVKLLGRYPWEGRNYKNRSYRVLILGDSHYAVDNNGNFCPSEYIKFVTDNFSTREVINCVIRNIGDGEPTWPMYRNLINTFTSYTPEVVDFLWSIVSFYNFIQRPMESIHQKPCSGDKIVGWLCLCYVINILKPNFCLFLGKRNEEGMNTIESLGGYFTKEEDEMFNKTTPIKGTIKTKEGIQTRYRIIQHPSYRGYSPTAWYTYLSKKERELMGQVDRYFK